MSSANSSDIEILDFLVIRGAIAASTKRTVSKYAERWACTHFSALIEINVISEAELADALALMAQVLRLHGISSQQITPEVLACLPFSMARELEAIPVNLIEETDKIEVAMANPTDSNRIEQLRRAISREIVLAVGERSDIVSAIDEHYPLKDRWPSMWGCVKSQ